MRLFKRIFHLTMIISMIFQILPPVKANANTIDYPMTCFNYEVSLVNDDGSFTSVGCYEDFYTARDKMYEAGDDAVVRHPSSYSPTKIIAMSYGIAYSYPNRYTNGSTLTITSYIDGSGKSTYVTQHRELTTAKTESYNGNGDGKVYVQLNGFEGYVNLKQIDLVPMKYIQKGIKIALGGNDVSANNEQSFLMTPKNSYYTVERNGNYIDLVYRTYSGYGSTEYKMIIGPAADWMNVGDVYYSYDNHTFFRDPKYQINAGTWYSYYEYLTLRSYSKIDASVYNQYLLKRGYSSKPPVGATVASWNQTQLWNEGQTFVDAQNTYGINALMVFSMACLESGYGRSQYAVQRNNLFGWNAFDSDPDKAAYFPSISKAIFEHMAINLRGYCDITDARFFGCEVGNKGAGLNVKYASDPYWGLKISAIAYEIDKLSKNYDGTLTDYDSSTLAIIDSYNVPVKESPDDNSRTLYTTTYGSGYQKDFTTVVLEQGPVWTKIQLTNGLNSNGSLVTHRTDGSSTGNNLNGFIAYDKTRSVGYVKTSYLKFINGKVNNDGMVATGDFVMKMNDMSLYSTKISLSGLAYQPGIYSSDTQKLEHTLVIYKDQEVIKTQVLESGASLEIEDSQNYQDAMMNGSIEISDLEKGTYTLKIKTSSSAFKREDDIIYDKQFESNSDGKNYRLYNDDGKLMLEVCDKEYANDYISDMSKISINDDLILHIKGFALIQGKDNTDEATLHELVFTSLDNDEQVRRYTLKNSTGDFDLTMAYDHGCDYSYAWYEDDIDISDLPIGEYVVYISTTIDGDNRMTKLYGNSKLKGSLPISKEEGKTFTLSMQNAFSYRVEIDVTPYTLEVVKKNDLPRIREAETNLMTFRLEQDHLKIAGSALIWNGSFSDSDEVKYTIDMINETDGTVYTYECAGSMKVFDEDAPWNNTERLGGQFNYDNTWFSFDIDMGDKTEGEYSFRLKIETKDYVEYVPLKSVIANGFPDTENIKGYINTNNKRKVMLSVKSALEPVLEAFESNTSTDDVAVSPNTENVQNASNALLNDDTPVVEITVE